MHNTFGGHSILHSLLSAFDADSSITLMIRFSIHYRFINNNNSTTKCTNIAKQYEKENDQVSFIDLSSIGE